MAKFLQRLLNMNEPFFSLGIRRLEQATGGKGIDTRLIADITHKSHDIIRKLGLDPADTTGKELYQVLISSVRKCQAEKLLLDADYVMMSFASEAVSFNLIDVIENSHHELSYAQRIVSHGQRSLRGEIVQRYINQGGIEESTAREVASEIGLLPETDKWYLESTNTLAQDNKAPLILTIGDIVTDAFIELNEDQSEIDVDDAGARRLNMEFGTKLPYNRLDIIDAVGNSANAAVAMSRLGLRTQLMSFMGDDLAGKNSLNYLAAQGVDTHLISVQKDQKSNYHFALRYGDDRTILIKYEDYSYVWQPPSESPAWIYLSMLSKNSWQLHEDLLSYLQANPETKLAFQPGTFHLEWGTEKLAEVYKRSYIVFMNREEAAKVTGKDTRSIKDLAFALHELGPEIVVITDGPDGAYVSGEYKFLSIPNYPDPAPPIDRTGAGDAFASTVVAALALGEQLETALTWAPINAMSVVQELGAQAGLLKLDKLKSYLKDAPEGYKIEEFVE